MQEQASREKREWEAKQDGLSRADYVKTIQHSLIGVNSQLYMWEAADGLIYGFYRGFLTPSDRACS